MPRQRIHHSRETYEFPDDFPDRLKRFREESGLSWAEVARRLGTYPLSTPGRVNPTCRSLSPTSNRRRRHEVPK